MRLNLIFSILLVGSALSCTQKAPEPPPLDTPVPLASVEACKNANLNFVNLTPRSSRDLINCLNGNYGALQPYKDFLDSINDQDLQTLLDVYNKHVYGVGGKRVGKILTLLDGLRDKKELKYFYKDVQILTSHGVLQAALPVLARVLGAPDASTRDQWKPATRAMRAYVLDMLARKQLSPLVLMSNRVFNTEKAYAAAWLLSNANTLGLLSTDEVVDRTVDIVLETIADGTSHTLLTNLSDIKVTSLPARVSYMDMEQISDLFSYLPKGSLDAERRGDFNKLQRLAALTELTDRELICYKGTRRIDNEFNLILNENEKNGPGGAQKFFLQTVPILFSLTLDSCQYPAGIEEKKGVLYDIALDGFAAPLSTTLSFLKNSKRLDLFKAVLKSKYVGRLGPVLEDTSQRRATEFLLEILQDMNMQDFRLVSQLLRQFATENLRGPELRAFVPSSVLAQMDSLPLIQQDLWDLEDLVSATSPDKDYFALKQNEVGVQFKNSVETRTQDFLVSFLRDGREDIKGLARALVSSFADMRGGLGDLMGVSAVAESLSKENPVQDTLADLLRDDDLLDRLMPVLWRLGNDPKFKRAIEFTGQIAGNGKLDIIVQFFQDALKSNKDRPLKLSDTVILAHKPINAGPLIDAALSKSETLPLAPELASSYKVCTGLQSMILPGALPNMFRCIEAVTPSDQARPLTKVANDVDSAGISGALAGLTTNIVRGTYVTETLDQLQSLWKSGELATINRFLVLAADDRWRIPYRLDGILKDIFQNPAADIMLQLNAKLLRAPNLGSSTVTALDLIDREPVVKFHSDSQFRLTVADPEMVLRRIQEIHGDWTPQQVAAEYKRAKTDFEEHNENWMHDYGVLPTLTDKEKRDKVIFFLKRMLFTGESVEKGCDIKTCERSTGLEEFVKSNQETARHLGDKEHPELDMVEFLRWGAKTQRADKWYLGLGDDSVIRIETALDELDVQLVTADMSAPLFFKKLYISRNAGIQFKLLIAGTPNLFIHNLPKAMEFTRAQLRGGANLEFGSAEFSKFLDWLSPGAPFEDRQKLAFQIRNRMRNLLETIYVLNATADNGFLKISQQQFRALMRSTPEKYRHKQDRVHNDLANIDRLAELGLFSNLSMGVRYMDSRPPCEVAPGVKKNCLDAVGGAFMHLNLKLKEEDFPALRDLLEQLVFADDGQGGTLAGYLVDRIIQTTHDDPKYGSLKDLLVHVLFALDRLDLEAGAAIRAAARLAHHPKAFKDLMDVFFDEVGTPDDIMLKLMANTVNLPQSEINDLRPTLLVALNDSWVEKFKEKDLEQMERYEADAIRRNGMKRVRSSLEFLVDDLATVYESRTQELKDLWTSFKAYRDDPATKALHALDFLRGLVRHYSGQTGIVDGATDLMAQPGSRQNVRAVVTGLGAYGDISVLLDELIKTIKNGKFDEGLNFIFEYLVHPNRTPNSTSTRH